MLSTKERIEKVRANLARMESKKDFQKKMIFETLGVCQAMNGWSIEYVLELGIDAYYVVVDFLIEQNEDWNQSEAMRNIPKTFR